MAARRRSSRQPYAWLGAGALTLGVGAAMVSGAAVASAQTGTADSASGADTVSSASRTASSAARTPAARVGRTTGAVTKPAAAASRGIRLGLPSATNDSTPPATPSAVLSTISLPETPAPAAAQATTGTETRASRSAATPASVVVSSSSTSTASTPNVSAPAATAPFPDSPPSPFLPENPIVPGSHVQLSLQGIADAQAALNEATFGSGNLLAGVASVVPQLFLAEAALSLNAWGAIMPLTQGLVAATTGIPILAQISQATLLAAMTLPSFAGIGFGGASLFMPVVGALGATTTQVTDLITQASEDGKVYAVVPVTVKANTEPTINIRVNGGPATSVLIDTGSSGLLVTRDALGSAALGPALGTGKVVFSGGSDTFNYTVYNAVVDLGGGAVTGPTPVFIVNDADATAYKNFLSAAGVVGILGTGVNTNGPFVCLTDCGLGDPNPTYLNTPVPTSVLPGELADGHLLYQDLFFGLLGGVMILGPNPFPTRISTPGVGYASVKVSINGGAQQVATSILDTGGVFGTMPDNLINLPVGSVVPNGTRIAVYSPTGGLLYSYTTANGNGPDVVNGTIDNPPDNPLQPMNSGNSPFAQGPVYFNYGAPGGFGSTDFAIW